MARAAADAGSWSPDLVSLFERLVVPRTVGGDVAFPGLSLTPRLADLKGHGPYSMAVSAPVLSGSQALLFLQFGHGYNGVNSLVLVGRSPKGWVVETEVVVSVGD
jgi:hypothetical protein